MVMKFKYFKGFMMAIVFCSAIWICGITVHAERVRETEPNDTRETAQLIQANRETAEQAVNADRPNQYVINGYTSTSDEDWYKVYLSAGIQYVTCNDNPFNFEVYDSNYNLIASESYFSTGFGSKAYPFTAPLDGYYYVKVKGALAVQSSYILLVGGCVYSVASCDVSMDSITMSGDRDVKVPIDLRLETRLPDGAIVYMISINGVKTTSVDGISVKNKSTNSIVRLPKFTWYQMGLVSMNMPLKSQWEINFEYYKNTTFTPSFDVLYAYPVTSEYVEDMVISN